MTKEIIFQIIIVLLACRFGYTEVMRVTERNNYKVMNKINLDYKDKIIELERNHTNNIRKILNNKIVELYKVNIELHQEIIIKDNLLKAKINDCNK